MTKQNGFSLIEILVVLVIMGLLISVVAPTVLNSADDARIQKVQADFKSIETALKIYRLDNYVYPTPSRGSRLWSRPARWNPSRVISSRAAISPSCPQTRGVDRTLPVAGRISGDRYLFDGRRWLAGRRRSERRYWQLESGKRLNPGRSDKDGSMRLTGEQPGFSLIELLVAVFVIVLLTGVVSLNVGRGGAELELESEVRHLSGLLAFSSAEAGLSAADHGLFIGKDSDVDSSGYEGIWLRRFDQGWAAPRASAEVFEPLRLSTGYELRLDLTGQPEVELLPYEADLNPSPQIVAWAGGEMTPGSLEWLDSRTGELLYRLEWICWAA